MTDFDENELSKLAALCRIACSPEEKKKLSEDLKKILALVGQLQEIDVDGASECLHVLDTLSNVMREDRVGQTLSREAFLANAPSHAGGMVRVPPLFKH
jgi:aspartyl-tRNA(Asn)/glutamyl-tRNA(Gln) amidotransferase subunit C